MVPSSPPLVTRLHILNFVFLEKDLELASPPCFAYDINEKCFWCYSLWTVSIYFVKDSVYIWVTMLILMAMSMMTPIRSSRTEVFCKRVVLRNFAKFTAKHLCQSLFFNKVAGTPFIIEHLWWLLLPNADFFKWLCFQYNVK